MTGEKDFELLESYILGTLPEEEAVVVRRRLSEEPELDALFHDLKILVTAVRHESRESISRELKEIESRVQPASGSRTLWTIGIAASVVLLVSLVFYFVDRPVSNDELFAANFTPYTNIVDPASRGPEDEQALAFRYYDEGNYEAAASEFNKLPKTDADIRFYLGNSLLASNQASEAIDHFKFTLQQGVFQGQSRWYLALCYLKLGDDENAIYYLEIISTGNSNYAEAASRILRELKKR